MRETWTIAGLPDLRKVGHITPSSNTALEPTTALMNRALEGRVSHHFGRLLVRRLELNRTSEAQFDLSPMVEAAALLADAPLDALVWNGTSASWLGLERDERLRDEIEARTGIAASTTTLAYHEAYRLLGIRRIGLAVPYTSDLAEKIAAEYGRHGFEVPSRAALGKAANVDIGNTPFEAILDLVRRADSPEAECIAIVCTNLPGATLAAELEEELGKPVLDSIAVTFWAGCRLAGVEPRLDGWGRLFDA